MTRSELIADLAARFPQLQQKDAAVAVTTILDAIAKSLAEDGRSEIRGFGSFSLGYRRPRMGRNPKTGDRVEVPAKWTPHFKPGLELRQRVDSSTKAK
jgi:integration host factor subunit beta